MKTASKKQRNKVCAIARFRPETQRPISRLPKASREALLEARDMLEHPEKYQSWTDLDAFLADLHS